MSSHHRYPPVRLDEGLWGGLEGDGPGSNRDQPLVYAIRAEAPPDVAFFVAGTPAPQGSKKAFRNKYTGNIQQVESSKRLPTWRADVKDAAATAMAGRQPLAGPLEVELRFVFARPRHHYGSGRNAAVLKPSAPKHMASGRDVDKLGRGVLDALALRTGGCVIVDDRMVTHMDAWKEWGERPGCHIAVRRLGE